MPDILSIFITLSVVLAVVTVCALVVRQLGQPVMVGYLIAGIIVGPTLLNLVRPGDALDSFGQIGVALLLFIVGLGLNPELLRDVGKASAITGLWQICITAILGFGLAIALGHATVPALYLAIAFTFSSTVVVLQLLYGLEEQDTLYGRISIGLLLVQDFVALFLLLLLTSVSPGDNLATALGFMAAKSLVVVAIIYLLTREITPRIDLHFARSPELLFLFALAICFTVATVFALLGFSLELGALMAGILLSVSPYHREIAAKLSPIRDFFLTMFFVVLGAHISPETLTGSWPTIAAFSLFILVGNPLIVIVIMRFMLFTLETSFAAALTVAQISEFSLVLLATGAELGHLPQSLLGPATLIGLITIFGSSFFITNYQRLYYWSEPLLRRLFGPDKLPAVPFNKLPVDVLLFGCHRLGGGLIETFKNLGLTYLVVDHDPDIVRRLNARNVAVIFGTADSPRFLEQLPFDRCRTVISTIPELEPNLAIVAELRRRNQNATILCVAYHRHHADQLYRAGATYVVVPPYLGRRYLIDLLKTHQLNREAYEKERAVHQRDWSYETTTLVGM